MKIKKKIMVPEDRQELTQKQKPGYEPPRIITYTSEEILEEIGPAQACSPSPCATFE